MEKSIGYISYTHGLDGKVKVVPMVKNELFRQYILENIVKIESENEHNSNAIYYTMKIFAFNGKSYICKIEGICSIDEAKKLTKKEIKINIEDDKILIAERLVGFNVWLLVGQENGQHYGKVIDYGNYGAGDLLEIKTSKGKTDFIACNKTNFVDIDYQHRIIFLKKKEII